MATSMGKAGVPVGAVSVVIVSTVFGVTNWELWIAQLDPNFVQIAQLYISPTNDPEDIRVLAGIGFDGVVELHIDSTSLCSGTLLPTRRHILTAAHCLTNGNGQLVAQDAEARFHTENAMGAPIIVTVNSAATNAFNIHPNYNGVGMVTPDLAIITLENAAPANAEVRTIYRGSGELGSNVPEVGFGLGGTGNAGATATSGIRRGGLNRAEIFGESLNGLMFGGRQLYPPGFFAAGNVIVQDFDNEMTANDALGRFLGINNLGHGSDEVSPYVFDSGGPLLISGKIAGVVQSGYGMIGFQNNPDISDGLNGSFGELAFYTRMSNRADWYDSVVPPVINGVIVKSAPTLGEYPVPSGSGEQIRTARIFKPNAFSFVLSEDIDASNLTALKNAVTVQGISQTYSNDTANTFVEWHAPTRTFSWGVNPFVYAQGFTFTDANGTHRADKLTITLDASVFGKPNAARLDGDWTNPSSVFSSGTSAYPSGEGNPGDNFVFRIIVLAGDLDRDNDVDLTDFNTQKANFGMTSGATWEQGDCDGDGDIDLTDFNILKANQGFTWTSF